MTRATNIQPSDFGLPQATRDKLCGVFSLHPDIHTVLVYGSRAKGNYRPGSDIDLSLLCDAPGSSLPFAEFLQIQDEIDDLMLPYSVDLSQNGQLANPDLQDHINRVGQPLYVRRSMHPAPAH